MTPFFSTQERIDKLVSVANSWLGTPFVPNAANKGRGVSCHKLCGAIYNECGFVTETLPDGSPSWGRAHKENESLIIQWIDKQPCLAPLDNMQSLSPGDLVGFKVGGCVQHLGIVIDVNKNFIHCMDRRRGVEIHNMLDATYSTRLSKAWRPIE